MASGPALEAFLDGWAAHEARLVEVIAPLTTEEVLLRPRPDDWAIWQLASNICGGRVHWMRDVLGEGDAALRDRFRVASTTVPGLPLEDAGWEDDEDHPRSAAQLVDGLAVTWALVESCARRWTPDDLEVTFVREYAGRRRVVSRAWVLWHLVEHDLQHGAEIALILRANGLPTIDL
jgi:uncharacterized damage-inducible protein DinB